MEALGRLNDVQVASSVDLTTAGSTGKRVALRNAGGVQIVVALAAAASGTETVTLTLQQHTAASSGTSSNLLVDHYYIKAQTNGNESWQKITQTASQTIAITDTVGTITGSAQKALVAVIEVDAQSLADGYTHVSVNIADPGTVSRLGTVVYNVRDLHVMRAPSNLPALQ
jgi:YbbR domain-containing protein